MTDNLNEYSYRSQLVHCWALVVISAGYLLYVFTTDDHNPKYLSYITGSILLIVTGFICTVLASIMIYKSNQPGAISKPSFWIDNKWWERAFIRLAMVEFGFAAFSFLVYLLYSGDGTIS